MRIRRIASVSTAAVVSLSGIGIATSASASSTPPDDGSGDAPAMATRNVVKYKGSLRVPNRRCDDGLTRVRSIGIYTTKGRLLEVGLIAFRGKDNKVVRIQPQQRNGHYWVIQQSPGRQIKQDSLRARGVTFEGVSGARLRFKFETDCQVFPDGV